MAKPPATLGALWERMEQRAADVPREQALLEAFEPVALEHGGLRVRVRGAAANAGYAASRIGQLQAMARAAAGGALRVSIDEPAPAAAASPRALPAAGADDTIRNHPLVRSVAALFDATIVRVESAGTLPADEAVLGDTEETPAGDVHV